MFITQACFPVPKDVRLNTPHFFIMKIPKNHLSNIDSSDFMELYRKCTTK